MADEINARDEGSKFKPHPEGQFVGKCVDTIDLGEKVDQFPGNPPRLVHKVALVFLTGEVNPDTGAAQDVSQEFTLSMGEKASLRAFLESWRGKSYTEEQAHAGVPLHKLVGNMGLLSVENKKSGSGRTYAKIKSISPVPKGLPVPELPEYQRADFWAERKKQYANDAKAFKAKIGAVADDDDFTPSLDDNDDDLPF